MSSHPLLTVGHGRLPGQELAELVSGAGVELLVDVRRFPGSRRDPTLSREALDELLATRGVAYRWEERLGGRRRLGAEQTPSPDTWWQVEAFRAYAGWTRQPAFATALDDVLSDADRRRTAVLCSESVWWRCHRRLIADVCVLARRTPVEHLLHDGRLTPHPPAAGARVTAAGVVWDG